MTNLNLRKALPYLGCILIFAAISLAYFAPDIFEGKILFQGDTQQGIANGQEAKEFLAQTGEHSRWSTRSFSGMPTYQMSPSYSSDSILREATKIFSLYLPSPASLVFIMLVGFFILLKSLKIGNTLSLLGSIAWAFSSYFFIIIEAGHIWKFITLAYVPPTIAGIIFAYRGKYLLGGSIFALFMAFQILSNHVQMSFYFAFVMVAIVIAYFVEAIKKGELKSFYKASAALAIASIVAIGANSSNLYHTYEYSKQTIRGKSELVNETKNQTAGGLDKDYITAWSYGIDETMTLLIPNFKGGATGHLGMNREVIKQVPQEYRPTLEGMNHYWGDQPFTSGPVYVGAIILALAIFGFIALEGAFKWSILAVTILTILLSWGRNFMGLTELFIDYFPMYNKFRTVSSILVVAEFTIPLMAILALNKIVTEPDYLIKKRRAAIYALASTAGAALLFAIAPSITALLSNFEAQNYLPQAQQEPQIAQLLYALEDARAAILSADAWRSFGFIIAGALALFLFVKGILKREFMIIALILLTLIDMWSVNKRYLNSENFVEKRRTENPFPKSAADEIILKDKDPNFRVFNLTRNPFNDAFTSYYHKSIGGYHAAKLQRYQDLIEHQISKQNPAVINMLNTKYLIVKGQNGEPAVHLNSEALGNAWFVSNIIWVDNANQEMDQLTNIDPRHSAVIDRRFETMLSNTKGGASNDSTDYIKLTSFAPNELKYSVHKGSGQGVAIFSEVWYDGWRATIDGKEVPIARANYILRAIEIPEGNHEVVFTFKPKSIETTERIAYSCIVILISALLALIYKQYSCSRKKGNNK